MFCFSSALSVCLLLDSSTMLVDFSKANGEKIRETALLNDIDEGK